MTKNIYLETLKSVLGCSVFHYSHSKSSYSRLIFCNQLIKYSMFKVPLSAIINTEERTLRASLQVAVVEVT